jgi:hypothetical protein
MGIVKLALIVLAMVFLAAPLPFSDELGGDALHFVCRPLPRLLSCGQRLFSGGAAQIFRGRAAD